MSVFSILPTFFLSSKDEYSIPLPDLPFIFSGATTRTCCLRGVVSLSKGGKNSSRSPSRHLPRVARPKCSRSAGSCRNRPLPLRTKNFTREHTFLSPRPCIISSVTCVRARARGRALCRDSLFYWFAAGYFAHPPNKGPTTGPGLSRMPQ